MCCDPKHYVPDLNRPSCRWWVHRKANPHSSPRLSPVHGLLLFKDNKTATFYWIWTNKLQDFWNKFLFISTARHSGGRVIIWGACSHRTWSGPGVDHEPLLALHVRPFLSLKFISLIYFAFKRIFAPPVDKLGEGWSEVNLLHPPFPGSYIQKAS